MNRYFIIDRQTWVSTGLLLLGGLSVSAQENKAPNIVFILADDLGWKDLHCTGSDYYETPNIDRIAAEGMRFTNGYAACRVSSPSRASLLTGKYTPRHGITNWIGEASGEAWRKAGRGSKLLPATYAHTLPAEEVTIAEALKAHGYSTFFAGKWHLGGKGSWPEDHGFEVNKGGWTAGSPSGRYFSPYKNPQLEDGPEGENLSIRLARETAGFIKEHARKNRKQPFLAYLSFYAVHAPLQTTQEKWRYFRDKAAKAGIAAQGFKIDRTLPVRQVQDNPVYAGLIRQMDEAVGIVMEQLKASGLDKNTIIVFTSDNGGVSSGDAYSTSNLPLRGGKGRQWEGGLRVPVLVRYPEKVQAGTVCDAPVIGIDFYPTFLDFAGISPMPGQNGDGMSIRPLLENKEMASRPLFWHYPHYGNQGGEPSSVVREGDWKLILYHEDMRCELYNLAIDPTESGFLNAQYPGKVKELKQKLEKWLIDVAAKMPEADPLYDPRKESAYLGRIQEQSLLNQEKNRNGQLRDDWQPGADWWGSYTND